MLMADEKQLHTEEEEWERTCEGETEVVREGAVTERFLKSCYCVIIPPLLSSQQSYLENIFQELSVPQQLVSMANGNLISDKSGESVIMHVKLNAPR